ncbi:hypothetical protein ACFQBQ_12150 [Granulicella cerasi]|uniref:NHL repeat containing protein n=1 Tax=Granulicella cerasi TaxID=741063 RepID=A0ABW1ZB95_9BACT|nr:hypothetical protein [Granulicella cerasi]
MQIKNVSQKQRWMRAGGFVVATMAAFAMVGCGIGTNGNGASSGSTVLTVKAQGKVFGGQQPISGSTIQLYAASQVGYNYPATALLTSTVQTDGNGNFSITGTYTCPYASSMVYLLATGGNAGAGTNANIAEMAPLGACGNLSSSTFVLVNEVTTVAGAYALAQFMSSPTQLSTSPTNVTGLTNAFATVNKLVTISTGNTPGTVPAGTTVPSALLNTLANSLAACVNTNGVGGSSNYCANLFSYTTPSGGSAPTDTLTAALNIAKNPGLNVSGIYSLASASAPFQPTLTTAPAAYIVAIKYAPTGVSVPSAAAVDSYGNVWITNAGNNTLTVLDATLGAPTSYGSGLLSAPSAIAFDANGNVWVPNKGNNSLSVFQPSGAGSVALSSSLSAPSSVAVDASGTVWVTNNGNNSVTAVTVSGTSVSGASSYSTGASPVAVAVNPN